MTLTVLMPRSYSSDLALPWRWALATALLAIHLGLGWWLTVQPEPVAESISEQVMMVDWREAALPPKAMPQVLPPPPMPVPPRPQPPTAAPVPAPAIPTVSEAAPVVPVAPTAPAVAEATPAEPAPMAPLAPAGPIATPEPVMVKLSELVILHQTEPVYPMLSKRLGETGVVRVRLKINEAGRVSAVEVMASSGFKRLDESALAAVRKWRFVPPTRNGVPVAKETTAPISFTLTDGN